MVRSVAVFRVLATAFGLVLAAPSAAQPPAPAAGADCIAAAEQGQRKKLASDLVGARETFERCTRADCPNVIRGDCARWIDEVTAQLPSVVISATDGNGRDVLDARVTVDGKPSALDGSELSLNPGPHRIEIERRGGAKAVEEVLVRAGEKRRYVSLRFGEAKTVAPAPVQVMERPVPPLVIGLGILSLAALGTAFYLDISATADAHHLRGSCAGSCTKEEVDAVRTQYVGAGIALGIGVVAAAAATYLFLTRPARPAAALAHPFYVTF